MSKHTRVTKTYWMKAAVHAFLNGTTICAVKLDYVSGELAGAAIFPLNYYAARPVFTRTEKPIGKFAFSLA